MVTGRLFRLGAPPAKTSDDYWTPPDIFDRMAIRFDVDVCAPVGGVPWVPADRYFTVDDDGLTQPWTGRVWMNPPYSNPTPWANRFTDHANGVALVPMTSGVWLEQLWRYADAIALVPRVHFITENRRQRNGAPYRIVAVAFGAECAAAVARIGPTRPRHGPVAGAQPTPATDP